MLARREDADNKKLGRLLSKDTPFYLLPLQLDSDAQIRTHSPFANMHEVMDVVFSSFAQYAPADAVLVVKNHPLDMGLVQHEQTAQQLARHYDLEQRMLFLQMGSMPSLLSHTLGVVTVNSTVGGSSLLHAVPTKVLGEAIYNLPELSYAGTLDDFWQDLTRPDMNLFHYFRNVAIHATQINGGFYTASGIKMAVGHSLPALLAPQTFIELNYGN